MRKPRKGRRGSSNGGESRDGGRQLNPCPDTLGLAQLPKPQPDVEGVQAGWVVANLLFSALSDSRLHLLQRLSVKVKVLLAR